MRRLLPALVLALVVPWAPVVVTSGAPAEARSASKIQSDLTGWTGEELAGGRTAGTVVRRGRVFLKSPATTTRIDGTTYDVGLSLLRRTGASTKPPSLGHVAATTSRRPSNSPSTSKPGKVARAGGAVLDVPRYSQMVHEGHYPQWGNGGEAWCSPTSVSMVLGYYDALPKEKDYSWVPEGHTAPWVDHGARMTYDHGYDGTGNWSFNVAYAARLVGRADVSRLPDLRAVERLVADGVPVIISIAFGAGELSGAPISSSNGHLLVVVGFTADGDVVVNDPAADSPAGVRRTYDRAQLERAWLDASTGTAYVLRD